MDAGANVVEKGGRPMLYEWREYKIVPGRMPAIKPCFRDITLRLLC